MYVGFIAMAYLLVYSTTVFSPVYIANKTTATTSTTKTPTQGGSSRKFHFALVESWLMTSHAYGPDRPTRLLAN